MIFTTRLRKFLSLAPLFLGALAATKAEEVSPPEFVEAVLHEGHLICLADNRTVTAWNVSDLSMDHEWTRQLSAKQPLGLAQDSPRLWIYDGSGLSTWPSSQTGKVERIESPSRDTEYVRLLGIKGEIYAIFPPGIYAIGTHRMFRVPELGGQLKINSLRILTVAKSGDDIWIGTGNGEWGGHLVKFNTLTQQWQWYYDSLHYVTGIAADSSGKIWVSWSMSHFSANTVIRAHGKDTNPIQEGKLLEQHYYQALAYSEFDHALYGVEQSTLGVIDAEGELTSPVNLGQIIYPRENNAIGVRPAVLRIIPLGPKRTVIVFNYGDPVMVQNGKTVRFEAPAPPLTASRPAS